MGSGIILDTSKYLNRLLEVDVERRTARVEPGIVLDELNAQLKPHNLRFAPDISTASRATLGGMMANNSAGARSVLYGITLHHVLEQHVVFADGTVAHLRDLSAPNSTPLRRRFDTRPRLPRRPPACERMRDGDRAAIPEAPAARRRLQPERVRERAAVQPVAV